jgi:hypothetical protein
MKSLVFLSIFLTAAAVLPLSCRSSSPEATQSKDQARCKPVDLGEATDLVQQGQLSDDRMAVVQGIADPRILVWRDSKTGNIFYITRIMGTEQKLFYLRQIGVDEKPGIESEFLGHLLRWDKLPLERSLPIANALATQYRINIKPESTYVIDADGKPSGCP